METRAIPLGPVTATLRGGQLLEPWQQFALNLINESISERPIYFASSGNAAQSLGLSNYLVRQGLAFKLYPGSLEEQAPEGFVRMVPSPYTSVTGDWVDVPRTRKLMTEVFIHRSGIPDDWSHWPDVATIGIPHYYSWGFLALTQAAMQAEQPELAERYQARAQAWSDLGS